MRIITRAWIMEHRTPKGAWCAKQIQTLGLTWPTSSGWIDQLIGQAIADDKAAIFEAHGAPAGLNVQLSLPVEAPASAKCDQEEAQYDESPSFYFDSGKFDPALGHPGWVRS